MAGPNHATMRIAGATLLAVALLSSPARAAGPEGQVAWAVHVTVAPMWFDPAETSGIITPFMLLVGPRVAQDGGLGVVANHPYSAPYEDLTLKTR